MLENGFQAHYKVSMPASTLMLRLGVNGAYLRDNDNFTEFNLFRQQNTSNKIDSYPKLHII